MEQEKITVIVPCYNVEKYVEKSINSLLQQTYKDIKIIAIDDCSTDNTYLILEQIKAKNPSKLDIYRNEKNFGLAYTRNRGIKLSKTEYIGFIDSDDYVDDIYYEKLMKQIIEKNADIVIADISVVNDEGMPITPIETGINTKIKDIKEAALDTGSSASACNKVFKKDIIEKFPFLEGKINEDVASVIPAMLHANVITYTDEIKYYYVQRENSIQNSKFSEKRFDIFDSVKVTLERIKDVENFEKYKSLILYHQILMLYVFLIIPLKGYQNRQKYIKLFIEKQTDLKIAKDKSCIKKFLDTKPKLSKIYWWTLINLLRLKSATLINLVASLSHLLKRKSVIKKSITFLDLIKEATKQKNKKKSKIGISVVVPNYNYKDFLMQRIYSILYQTEKIKELIILDDCSTDGSRELIDEMIDKLQPYISIKKVYNEINTGRAFSQWQKGFELANGDYVWIAEADDYCDKNMLKELVKQIRKNNKISIAYVDTAFIDKEGKVILKSIKPEIDIRKTGHWNHSYINNGQSELQDYTFLNCTIANVSSCLIKNGNYREIFEKAKTYIQAGDWVFYSHLMTLGDVAYVNKTYNYYRMHGDNVSSVMDKQEHLKEIKKIHSNMRNLTSITNWHEKEFVKRYDFLEKVWKLKE